MDVKEIYRLREHERRTKSLQRFPEEEIEEYLRRLRKAIENGGSDEVRDELRSVEFYIKDILKIRARKIAVFVVLSAFLDTDAELKNLTDTEKEIYWQIHSAVRKMYERLFQ